MNDLRTVCLSSQTARLKLNQIQSDSDSSESGDSTASTVETEPGSYMGLGIFRSGLKGLNELLGRASPKNNHGATTTHTHVGVTIAVGAVTVGFGLGASGLP